MSNKTDATEETEGGTISFEDGADEIISDTEEDGTRNVRVPNTASPETSPISESSFRGAPVGAGGISPLSERKDSVHTNGMYMGGTVLLSDDDTLSQDSFADANSDEIYSDEELSISEEEEDDDDRYNSDDEEDYYEDLAYRTDSEDEITVEDALATIVEEEEEDESSEEGDEGDEDGDGNSKNIKSLYSYSNDDDDNEYGMVYEDDLAAGERSARPARVLSLEDGDDDNDEEDSLNDSGYFITRDTFRTAAAAEEKSEEQTPRIVEKDDFSQLLKSKDWNALMPFLQKFLQSRADVDDEQLLHAALTRMDTYGNTKSYPIHFVVWRAPTTFIKQFIGAIPSQWQSETLSKVDAYGNTPLHLACSRLEATIPATKGDNDAEGTATLDVSVVEMISECGPETHELLNKQGDSPLSLLLKSNAMKADPVKFQKVEATAEKLVRSMLQDRIHLITRKNMFDFKTLLHIAAANGAHEKVLLALLEMAGPSIGKMADTAGRIPLHYVAGCMTGKSPQATFAEQLIQAHPLGVVHKTTSGDTPLHIFVSSIQQRIKVKEDREGPESNKITKLLIGSTENEDECALLVKNSNALSPLHCCALFNTPAHILKSLMESPFAARASTVTDTNSATALHLACASSRCRQMIETIKILGTTEAAVMRDNKSRTPMHVAAENPNVTKRFVKALAEVNPKAAKVRNSKGRMPMHVALRKRAKDSVIKALLKTYPKAVRSTFSGRNSVFHEMCQYKTSAAIMKAMLKMHPPGVKLKNKFGNLPLHVAIVYECPTDVLQQLLDAHSAGCLTKNKSGETPLHYAAANNSVEVTKLLLSLEPKAAILKNKKGETPVDQAKANTTVDPDLVKILEDTRNSVYAARALKKRSSNKDRIKKPSSARSLDDTESTEKKPKRSSSSKSKTDQGTSKQTTSSKRRSVSPGTKKRSSRRISDSESSKGSSPTESPKTAEKRSLRRMLKSSGSGSRSKSPLPDPPIEPPSQDRLSKSDHPEKKEKTSFNNSDHARDRRPRGGGLSRSKSDRGFRADQNEILEQEEVFSKQLKESREFEGVSDRSFRRGGRKPTDPSRKDSSSLSPKVTSSKGRSRSRSRKRRSGVSTKDATPSTEMDGVANSNGDCEQSTSPGPPPVPVETPKASIVKKRSSSKKRCSSGASLTSLSSVGSDPNASMPTSADSKSTDSKSADGSTHSTSGRKSGPGAALASLRNSLKRSTSRKFKKNSAKLGMDETPISTKKFSNSKRGTLVDALFSSDKPFQSKLPMEEEDNNEDTPAP
eukprot:scaffold3955_cov160-Cylindrotheca_fusiformis.AAC.3